MLDIENNQIQQVLEDSLKTSRSYEDYRNLVSKLVENESTTGAEQTEALVNYTKLNDRRMKRWDKTLKVSEAISKKVKDYTKSITWLVLTESWCGDAAHVMPVINKLAELNDLIDLKVVLRDDNDVLMDAFLTRGGRSIPKLIMIDNETGDVLNSYGPRPSSATKLVDAYKAEHGELTAEFKEELQGWYNKDKGQTAMQDLLGLLKR